MVWVCFYHAGGSVSGHSVERGIRMISLCGQVPCPAVCVRVCHCPAGMARVHWLWLIRRGYRVGERPVPWMRSHPPEPIDRSKLTFPTHTEKQAAIYGTSQLKPWASRAVLLSILAFMAIVLLIGFITNGPNLVPHYRAPDIYYWESR